MIRTAQLFMAVAISFAWFSVLGADIAHAADCPGSYTNYRGTTRGISCYCPPSRTRRGSVWGTGVYTDDSAICRAAVHAGAIAFSGGNVFVRGTRGRRSYRGSNRNGVGSASYGKWHWSYTVQRGSAGGGTTAGGGGNRAFCNRYANTAVSQHRQNIQRRCGFRGNRWSYNRNGHFNWCMRVSRASANGETNGRTSQLRNCRRAGGGGTTGGASNAHCRWYAQTADNQQRQNLRRRCGYKGGQGGAGWGINYRAHYDWCKRVPVGTSNRHVQIRNDLLRRCRPTGGGNRAFCNRYADTAVNQNRQNIRRRCGFRGNRWSNNRAGHFNWCMRVSRRSANAETNGRVSQLRNCRRGGRRLFKSRWDKIGGPGGPWTTGWVRNHTQPVCGHRAPGCRCGRGYCGNYRSGATTYTWPRGCRGPRWRIRCTSVPQ